jgi:DNA-binding response OmpR family regulator
MVATFMSELEDQVNTLNWNLDQLILFEKSINQMVYFPEIIPVSDLIGFVLESLPEESSRVRWIGGESADLPGLHVDIGLTTIAFEYLLMEMLSLIPSGQGIEITAKSQDGNLSLSLVSNLPMTLPGLEEKLNVADPRDFNTQLHLAQQIISHQGGKLTIKERNSNSQIGLEVEVSLPTISTTDQSSLTLNLGAQDQDQAGRILLAISQPEYQAILQQIFSDQGYRVDLAVEGRGALDMAQRIQPDLILVDRTLPGLDGLLLTQGIRRWSSVPIIMISSRSDPDDLLHAFQAGVDDYIRTPFRSDEILVRVQAAVRRGIESKQDFAPDIFTSDQVRINYSTRQVWIRGIPASLTPTEYNLVAYMSRHKRQTLSYDQLIERAWPGPEKGTRQGLFVHIRRLRIKIEQDIQNPKIIQNKWGVGYIFYPDQHS